MLRWSFPFEFRLEGVHGPAPDQHQRALLIEVLVVLPVQQDLAGLGQEAITVLLLLVGAEQIVEQPFQHIAATAETPLPAQTIQVRHQIAVEVKTDPLSGFVRLFSHGSHPSALGSLAWGFGSGSPLVPQKLLLGLHGIAIAIHQGAPRTGGSRSAAHG